MMRFIPTVIALLLATTMSIASAQSPEPSSDIVVSGEEQRKLMRGFVNAMTQEGPTDQLGRWNREFCPAISGISPEQAKLIDRQITKVARTAKLRHGSRFCQSSMFIFFSNDAQSLAETIYNAYPVTLRKDGNVPLNRFLNSDRPVRWLSVTNPCGFGCGGIDSRIRRATAPAFGIVLILVDGTRIGDYRLGEIADYLALVALTNPPAEGTTPGNSIMTMFDRPRVADERFTLTDRDRSFLTSLYTSDIDIDATRQKTWIANRMARQANMKPSGD